MKYLNLLTPRNCYIFHRDQAYSKLADLQTEPIYGTQFKLKKFEDEKLAAWETIQPNPNEKLGHPPENIFVPKETPESMKVNQAGEEPGKP